MNERMALWSVLLAAGVLLPEEYQTELHAAFLSNPENADLQELEWRTGDLKATAAMLCEPRPADTDRFCVMLFDRLEKVYWKQSLPAAALAAQMLDVWRALPEFVNPLMEPFYTLHYLGDYLPPYGSEAQVRALLEAAFALARTKGENDHEL